MSEFVKKDTFVQAQKELYKCVSLSELIKKDTFVQVQKEQYKCVSLPEFINLWPVLAPRAIDCDRSI